MRFGLSDLDELPSLKEFEALAREALGTDDGLAEAEAADEPASELAAGNGEAVSPVVEAELEQREEATAAASDSETDLAKRAARGGTR